MNLSKKRKLIAIITSAIMCLAIVITASIIFAPNLYKSSDIDTDTTANNPYATYDSGGYGMTQAIEFNTSNMALSLAYSNSDDHIWIYYPSKIYMDTTETLQDLGYYYRYYAHYGNSNNSDYHHILFHAPMGYYRDKSGNTNGKYNDATNNNANMEKFFNNYSIEASVPNGAKKNLSTNDNWTWNQSGGDGSAYKVVYYEGGVFSNNNQVKTEVKMSGTGKEGSYTYKRMSGSPIFAVRKYETLSSKYQWHLTSTVSASSARSYGNFPSDLNSATPITDDVTIQIEIYDKSGLLNALKSLDAKFTALSNAGLLLQAEKTRYTNFRDEIVRDYLNKREVTRSQLSSKVTEVNNYVFNTYINDPSLGIESNPQTANYTGNAYGLANFWSGYNGNIPNTSTSYATCFPSGTMSYSPTGFTGGSTNVTNKNNLTEAGYYTVTFTPATDTKTISVGGQSVKVKFTWQNGSTGEKTAYFRILPAEIKLTNMPSSIEMVYNGNTPNVLDGLPSGTNIELVRSDLNQPIVQLSTEYKANDVLQWDGVGSSIEFADVTDGDVKVWYRVSATNHTSDNSYGTFIVRVKPADIELTLKHFDQMFYTDLLTSEGIFENMLDSSTRVLDATNFEDAKNYLNQILTFAILKKDGTGHFDPATDKPDVGSYTIDAVKTTNAQWAKRINSIKFASDSNINSYQITPRPIEVKWTDNPNKWFNNTIGHRPSAQLVDGQDTCGQEVGLSLVSVEGGEAINVGEYTAKVSSTNPNFEVSNPTYGFEIFARKISITIVDRERTYAQSTTADNVETQYKDTILANNTNNEAYIATLDSEIANVTGSTNALVNSNYKDVFKVDIVATRTADNKYFVAGEHTLELTLTNNNYQLVSFTNGKFNVLPATLQVTQNQVAPKVYDADYQDIILPINSQTVVAISGYEKEHIAECVSVEYSSVGRTGPWSSTPLQIKNVSESPKIVYYKVSAPNHIDYISDFKQEMGAVNILFSFSGQTQKVYYGDEIPSSDNLFNICGGDYSVSERLNDDGTHILPEDIKDIHPLAIFDLYLLDPKTGQAVVNRNADAGKYTVTHRIKATVDEDINNFNVVYNRNEDGERENVNVYEISAKTLHIEWSQSRDGWNVGEDGATKDWYTFSNSIPTVFPTAPNSYDGKVNVVSGDIIELEGIELDSPYVNDIGYEVTTRLTKERNKNNYIIENPTHKFFIKPLTVQIVVKDQTAKYGQAQQVPLGVLIDPLNVGAIWDYATGSDARFFADHYSNWKFVSPAHSDDGSLVDVNDVEGYDIGYTNNTVEGMDGSIRKNYNLEIVKEGAGKNAKFFITPADIRFTGREFNIDFDAKDEKNYITKQMLIDRISTGLEDRGVNVSEFNVKMSQKFVQPNGTQDWIITESNATWVEQTEEVTSEEDCKRYNVMLVVEHPNNNFNKFVAYVKLNILSKWVSVKVGGGVTDAEYGYEAHSSDEIFESLDILSISGFMQGNDQLWNVDKQQAIALLKEYVRLFVGTGDLNTEMTENGAVGDYTIFMDVVKTNGEYENFRFVARDGETDTSNINAYHVLPRTISVDWGNLNEIYGEHGNSHTAYQITGVKEGEESLVRFELKHGVADIEGNTAEFYGGHAFKVGTYTIEVVSVSNPNYRIDKVNDTNLTNTFVISPKVIEIDLHDRSFVYGVENARVDFIDEALNIYSQNPYYDVVSKTPFVGSDKRTDIFEIYLASDKGSLTYLPVGNYIIDAKQKSNGVSINYKIDVRKKGNLVIDPATAGLSIKQLSTMYFTASEQEVTIDKDWLVLAGDVDYIKDVEKHPDNLKISYKFVSRDDYRAPESTEFIKEGDFKIRDAGRYVIRVRIEALNHNVFEIDVNLNVTPANVIIKMNPTSKVYGDKIENLSDWLKNKCGITITRYRDFGNGNREEWDITADSMADFVFYVVDPNKQDGDGGDELVTGSYQNTVGFYRVYHKMADGALASNYIVEYYQAPESLSKCNARAYEITPRPTPVEWSIRDVASDWNSNKTQYYYTGHAPALVATFNTLADANGNSESVSLQIEGLNNFNVNEVGTTYIAQVVHSFWDSNQYALNYTLTEDTYEYTIVKRPILITVDNQGNVAYGTAYGNPHITQENTYKVHDMRADADISLQGNPIRLVLENTDEYAGKLLPAGSYKIYVECSNSNYDVTIQGAGGDCGLYVVNKANLQFVTSSAYEGAKYLGEDFTLDFKSILPISQSAFAEHDDWESAWANAEITYKQNGVDVDLPVFTGAGLESVEYTLKFANYNDFNGTYNINVHKALVRVSITQVSSIYGDGLLTSEEIFGNSQVVLASGSDPIRMAIDDIIQLNVDANIKNVGSYDIQYTFVGEQGNNFEIDLVDNAHKYVVTPRVIGLEWSMDESDATLDADGKYVFDGKPHKIIFGVTNVIDGDVIEPKFEETSQKDQAKTYIARLIGIGTNSNYAMPEDCSFEWTIKPRPISVEWTVGEYTYDGDAKVPSAKIKVGEVLEGTSCGLTIIGNEINAGTHTATALTTSDNYVVSNAKQSFTIKPKQINVIWSDDTFVYDGKSHAPKAEINENDLVPSDIGKVVVNVKVNGAQTNAGNYTATVAGLDNSNYVVVGASKSFVIEKKFVTIHWTDTDFDYTGEVIAPNAKLEGVLNGDKVDLEVSGGMTNVGTYTATATGLSNGNYVLAQNAVKEMDFTINKVNNEFDGLYGVGDSKNNQVGIPWQGENKPTDKFGGEVIIKYYDDAECTKEISVDKIKDGTYWAVAYVAGTDNYNELVSSPFEFTIDNGMNVALAVSGIVISVVMLGAVLAIILIINKKKKGGNV